MGAEVEDEEALVEALAFAGADDAAVEALLARDFLRRGCDTGAEIKAAGGARLRVDLRGGILRDSTLNGRDLCFVSIRVTKGKAPNDDRRKMKWDAETLRQNGATGKKVLREEKNRLEEVKKKKEA